jgi:hypothetical protein
MKLDRAPVRAFSVALLAALTGGLAIAQPPVIPQAARPTAVILELAQNGGELTPTQQEAVETAILAMAKSADVVLCLDGRSSIADSALESLCARQDRNLPRLWWKARIVMTRVNAVDFLRLSVELQAGGTAPAGPAQLVVLSRMPLPPAEGKVTDLVVAEEIGATLADFPDVGNWFGALQQRPDLVRAWPSAKSATAGPVPRKKIEIEGSKDTPPKAHAASDFFPVREALVGGGFNRGVTGNLRVSPTGLGFTRDGKKREEWSIPWRELQEVSKDTGTWDIPHPLVIIDHKGRKRYIARIDNKGSYLPGDAILAAIRQKRSARNVKLDEEVTELK